MLTACTACFWPIPGHPACQIWLQSPLRACWIIHTLSLRETTPAAVVLIPTWLTEKQLNSNANTNSIVLILLEHESNKYLFDLAWSCLKVINYWSILNNIKQDEYQLTPLSIIDFRLDSSFVLITLIDSIYFLYTCCIDSDNFKLGQIHIIFFLPFNLLFDCHNCSIYLYIFIYIINYTPNFQYLYYIFSHIS